MESVQKNSLPVIPGRGLVTRQSTQMRLDYLDALAINTDTIKESGLHLKDIQKNIESYIGSVEVPLGIVGPLLFNDEYTSEQVYCAAGTLEGALIASMNRGAKAISLSGGISAKVEWQKMLRAPQFIFGNEQHAAHFIRFTTALFPEIKKEAEKHSNHACLLSIEPIQTENAVTLRFAYTTGDASGQNMTTSCTWHAMLFIVERFKDASGIICENFVIEGNGASDKKISNYAIHSGRGIRVKAECTLRESVINEVLRTTSEKILLFFEPSKKLAAHDGMLGYNINVANAIAAIYVATGQDLGTLHESGTGFLDVTKADDGLKFSLTLTNLVVGTVGGGTHLPKQNQALEMMGCNGNGKVERFAKLIASFALGLDISTYASVVSGEFAKAHEKLGRNKPMNWLLRADLTSPFITQCLNGRFEGKEIISATVVNDDQTENGILTNVAGKISKKVLGFIPVRVDFKDEQHKENSINLLIKSKALDDEVIKGLHIIAASIDPELSDEIKAAKNHLEYKNCHVKEIEITSWLHKLEYPFMPLYFGKKTDAERDIYLFVQESLDFKKLRLVNTENRPELWTRSDIGKTIEAATIAHQASTNDALRKPPTSVTEFEAWRSSSLYTKMATILQNEERDETKRKKIEKLHDFIKDLKSESESLRIKKCIVHNDFNPRNIAIRENGDPAIYDWELAVINIPHRDIVELLSFVLPENFSKETLLFFLYKHYDGYSEDTKRPAEDAWFAGYRYAIKEYLVSRVAFYEVAGILLKYEFSGRVFNTAFRMLELLETHE